MKYWFWTWCRKTFYRLNIQWNFNLFIRIFSPLSCSLKTSYLNFLTLKEITKYKVIRVLIKVHKFHNLNLFRHTLVLSTLKTENIIPTKRSSIIWYEAWVLRSTWEGWTVIWGWEWYHPKTFIDSPIASLNSEVFIIAECNCSVEISTLSFLLSDLCRMINEVMYASPTSN